MKRLPPIYWVPEGHYFESAGEAIDNYPEEPAAMFIHPYTHERARNLLKECLATPGKADLQLRIEQFLYDDPRPAARER